MSQITETRRALRAAVEPLLYEGEEVTVAAGPSSYEQGLGRLGFAVTVTVGAPTDETAQERLDELLSDVVKAALEDTDGLAPTVTKTSGYQTVGGLLGATWTVETLT